MSDLIRLAKKPTTCPNCGSGRVADILYGYPMPSIELKNKIKTREVILGGCVVSGDDPAWECADCGTQIYKLTILKRMISTKENKSYVK